MDTLQVLQQNKAKNPTTTVPKKGFTLVLLYLGVQNKIVTRQLKTCINKFCGCINLRVIFQKRLSHSVPTKIGSTVPNCQKLFIRIVVGTARISILEKLNVDCMTEKRKILKRHRVPGTILIHSKISSGIYKPLPFMKTDYGLYCFVN